MELKFIEKKEKTVEGTRYARETYTIGAYTVTVDDAFYENGNSRRTIEVQEPWGNDDYIPHIYYRNDYFGKKVSSFEIQTTSYGALDAEQFKKFLASQQTALEVVEILNKKFA